MLSVSLGGYFRSLSGRGVVGILSRMRRFDPIEERLYAGPVDDLPLVLGIHAVDTVRIETSIDRRDANVEFYASVLGLAQVDADVADENASADDLFFELNRRRIWIQCLPIGRSPRVDATRVRLTLQACSLARAWKEFHRFGVQAECSFGESMASQRLFVSDPTGHRIELFRVWSML